MNEEAGIVSVIIPTYNRAAYLTQTLESVFAVANDGLALEVIIVDDGSSDETSDVARAHSATYLRTERPGPAGARNAGLAAARGDYIAFLDDDDVWVPHNLAAQLMLLRANSQFTAAYGQLRLVDAQLEHPSPPTPPDPPGTVWTLLDVFETVPLLGALVVRADAARQACSIHR